MSRTKVFLFIAALTIALVAGWKARGWFEDAQALQDYKNALNATEKAYQDAMSDQAAEIEKQRQHSITLEQQNAALTDRVASLREEIDHATFTPPVVDSCRAHPVSSPEFVRLYNKSARGGKAEPSRTDTDGVSPRDD